MSRVESDDSRPRLFADFNNADALGRLRLVCTGTQKDLSRLALGLRDGQRVIVSDEDSLEADGIVRWSSAEAIWVAEIQWDALRQS